MTYRFREFEIPDYMMDGVERYVKHGILPGSFMTAVLENNFSEAVGRADDTNIHNLPAYAAYMYNEMPASCWGSREKVLAWVNGFAATEEKTA